ncbi:MAG: Rsd/AlgQ family anti-sigma factor [Pseudomonadales bacterium]|nr:Rsd/AlgQ family anti-sigma factor [Pseudomonadales bacterium]MCP5303336.1 Rsd/AlgQ family anti-sigma factor [Pseudomonadales bacterium]
MGQINRTGVDRRIQSQSDISALVASRSEALSLYTELAAHRPFIQNERFEEELKHFCEALIDYTASAHFRLYQHLAENKERRKPVTNVADDVYPLIAKTTDKILAFNDRYGDEADLRKQADQIEQDLSKIGEILADRIQCEDKVIKAMRSERRDG